MVFSSYTLFTIIILWFVKLLDHTNIQSSVNPKYIYGFVSLFENTVVSFSLLLIILYYTHTYTHIHTHMNIALSLFSSSIYRFYEFSIMYNVEMTPMLKYLCNTLTLITRGLFPKVVELLYRGSISRFFCVEILHWFPQYFVQFTLTTPIHNDSFLPTSSPASFFWKNTYSYN